MKQKQRRRQTYLWRDLGVVLAVIGVLFLFALPKYRNSIERSIASEAYNFLSSVRASQERYQHRQGIYTDNLSKLDIQIPESKHFITGAITAGDTGSLDDSWTMTLIRRGNPAGFGTYTITFGQDGFKLQNSTISSLKAINPMAG